MNDKALVPVAAKNGALTTGGAAEYNLDNFPTAQFNRLIPTQTIMTSDLLAPVIQIVKLDTERDCYSSPDVPAGNKAIGRTGLRKLVTAAAISILDNRRTDDAKDPDVCEMTAIAEMILPTGQRIRATGVKRIDIRAQKWASDNQRAKFRSYFQEHVASRAENRAIRALLSLQASYPVSELAKPFAVVSFVPNTANPEVRAAMLQAMAPAVTALYGPEQAKAIGPGTVTEAPQAPDDDQVSEGQFTEPEPEWAGTAPEAPKPPSFADHLRSLAAASKRAGGATREDLDGLKPILLPLGTTPIRDVMAHLWGGQNADGLVLFTGAQAHAIKTLADSMGLEAFQAAWRELDIAIVEKRATA